MLAKSLSNGGNAVGLNKGLRELSLGSAKEQNK